MKKTLIAVIILSFVPVLTAQQIPEKLSLKNPKTRNESASLDITPAPRVYDIGCQRAENIDDDSRSLNEHAQAQKDLEGHDKAENRFVSIK